MITCYLAFRASLRRTWARTRKFCQARSYDRLLLRFSHQSPSKEKQVFQSLLGQVGKSVHLAGVLRDRPQSIQPSARVQLALAATSFIELTSGKKKKKTIHKEKRVHQQSRLQCQLSKILWRQYRCRMNSDSSASNCRECDVQVAGLIWRRHRQKSHRRI